MDNDLLSSRNLDLHRMRRLPCSKQYADTTDSGFNGDLINDAFSVPTKNSFCTESSYPYKATDGTFQEFSSNGVPYMEEHNAMYQRLFGPNREIWAEQAQPLC